MTTNKRVRGAVLSSSIAVGVLALLMVGLFAGAARVDVIAQGPPACEDTTVEFQEVTDDNGNYTWSYTVCQTGFALSHWVLGLCPCFSDTESIVAVGYIDADGNETVLDPCNGEDGDPCYELGYDPTTMLFGLKWDNLDGPENECWTFYVTVNRDLAEEELEWASKYAACDPSSGTVIGPACPCDEDCRPVIAFKYYDVNRDGEYKPNDGDYPLSGWQMALISDTDELTSGVTNGDGYVDLGCWPSGTYTVCETLKEGWVNTEPGDNDEAATAPISVCQSVTIDGNRPVFFGNYEDEPDEAYIRGFKYHDVNGSGSYDNGDHPLNDWEICRDDTENDCLLTCDTCGGSGGFTEYWVVEAGTYTLCETLEGGWVNSDPGGDEPYCKSVTVEPGEFKTLEFGNWRYATKSGFKFRDVNHSGSYEEGTDELLPGWVIHLWTLNPSGQPLELVYTATTDANGQYVFDQVVPGQDYLVCEVLRDGWVQVYPTVADGAALCPTDLGYGYGPYGYDINLQSGEVEDGNNFGNDPRVVVGGVSLPTSGLALLAPWIVLGSLVGLSLVGASIVVWRRRGTSR